MHAACTGHINIGQWLLILINYTINIRFQTNEYVNKQISEYSVCIFILALVNIHELLSLIVHSVCVTTEETDST